MKKITAMLLTFVFCFSFSACGKRISNSRITDITCIRLSDNQSVTFEADEGFLAQLKGPFKKDGKCKGEEEHIYHITLTKNEKIKKILYLTEDGCLCEEKVRYISKEDAEVPLDISAWDNIFEMNMREKEEVFGEQKIETDRSTYPLEIVKSPPKELEGAEGAENTKHIITVGKWEYFISDMKVDGKPSTILWRRSDKGDQRIFNIPQPENPAEKHTILYVENSYQDSKNNRLYFMVKNGYLEEYALWSFHIQTAQMSRLLYYPCSNMVVMKAADQEDLMLGRILRQNNLMAVNMETGYIDYTYSRNLEGALVEGIWIREKEENRYATLSKTAPGVLNVEVHQLNHETGEREERPSYQININTYKMVTLP